MHLIHSLVLSDNISLNTESTGENFCENSAAVGTSESICTSSWLGGKHPSAEQLPQKYFTKKIIILPKNSVPACKEVSFFFINWMSKELPA